VTITATYQGLSGASVSGPSQVTVSNAALSSITITPNPLSVVVGGHQQLTATGTWADTPPTTADITNNVTWLVSNADGGATASATVSKCHWFAWVPDRCQRRFGHGFGGIPERDRHPAGTVTPRTSPHYSSPLSTSPLGLGHFHRRAMRAELHRGAALSCDALHSFTSEQDASNRHASSHMGGIAGPRISTPEEPMVSMKNALSLLTSSCREPGEARAVTRTRLVLCLALIGAIGACGGHSGLSVLGRR